MPGPCFTVPSVITVLTVWVTGKAVKGIVVWSFAVPVPLAAEPPVICRTVSPLPERCRDVADVSASSALSSSSGRTNVQRNTSQPTRVSRAKLIMRKTITAATAWPDPSPAVPTSMVVSVMSTGPRPPGVICAWPINFAVMKARTAPATLGSAPMARMQRKRQMISSTQLSSETETAYPSHFGDRSTARSWSEKLRIWSWNRSSGFFRFRLNQVMADSRPAWTLSG
ncbi:hypothetical protein BJF89_04120 [Corynebacterium sp. CNJ-954]|nr:hypothetical protein BJF89_04120 [Corynebacterium sp. CNJ-954]